MQVLENKNNNLIKEIQELQDYLIKRPSKDEDIETINRLKDEIAMLEKNG